MTGVWIPPSVSHELRDESAQREGRATPGLIDGEGVDDFNRDLEAIVPGMRLKWCPDPAPMEAVAMGARPGRWGILVPGQKGGPASVKPIIGPDGCFVDPILNASAIFDGLRADDWCNSEVRRDRDRAKAEAKRIKKRREEQEREEFNQEVLERYLAVSRAQVSMDTSVPWTQNSNGRRGGRRDA